MTIKKIEPEGDFDNFGGRCLKVKTDKGTFYTPERRVTSTEFEYKQQLPVRGTIDNPVGEIVSDFRENELNQFLAGNGPFKNRKMRLESLADVMEYSNISFYPQFKKDVSLKSGNLFLFTELQLYTGVEMVSIPPFYHKTFDEYAKVLVDYCNGIRDSSSNRQEPLPYLDMGLPPSEFQKKADFIWSLCKEGNELVNSMGVIYRPINSNIINYSYLHSNRERNILIHASGVERIHNPRVPTSEMHILQRYGIDTYSIKTKRFYKPPTPIDSSKEKEEKPDTIELDKLRFYDPNTIGVIKINEWNSRYNTTLNCDCIVCRNKDINDFIDKYAYDHNGAIDNQLLIKATKIHELSASTKEFGNSKKYIKEGGLKDYFGEKEYLKKVSPVSSTTLEQFL
ncbi:MAG: hypothetical protein KKD46_02600 [Euryarchaeota archaeon]|nr:hypothetical protein [Euryarchaeota archaeon]MBU4339798.1 hypothetical protein [Euryarchaeota archaeon]MCG2737031.1 hypothetical protein [Candidatus Methanoperedenaceae archaeon]